jgi:hypothetical protein
VLKIYSDIDWKMNRRNLAFPESCIILALTTAWVSREANMVIEKGRKQEWEQSQS